MTPEYKDFKDALQNWTNRTPPGPATVPTVPHHIYQPSPQERVVGGDVIRTPVDRVAARVVAKAPWWAKPPDIKTMSKTEPDPVANAIYSRGLDPPVGISGGLKKEKDFNAEVVTASTKQFTKSVQNAEDLVTRAKEATDAIEYLCTHVKVEWAEFDDFITKALTKTRATKVSFEIENRQLLASLRDVRTFFFDEKHITEVARLKEFIELCERLQSLQKSGFLDTIADTILKLEGLHQPL